MDSKPKKNDYTLKKLIFPPLALGNIIHAKIDEESIKFITFYNSAQEITNIIMNNLDDMPGMEITDSIEIKMSKLVITDMTAGVGGNVLNFANYFKYVNGIEIDNLRHEYLQSNVNLYKFLNVNCYRENSTKILIEEDNIVQDIVFFDPPWGGVDYKNFTNMRLNFDSFSIESVCKMLFTKHRNNIIVLKLPNNYDTEYLITELSPYKAILYRLDRMLIVVVKKYLLNNYQKKIEKLSI